MILCQVIRCTAAGTHAQCCRLVLTQFLSEDQSNCATSSSLLNNKVTILLLYFLHKRSLVNQTTWCILFAFTTTEHIDQIIGSSSSTATGNVKGHFIFMLTLCSNGSFGLCQKRTDSTNSHMTEHTTGQWTK